MARVKGKHLRDFWTYVRWYRRWDGPRPTAVELPKSGPMNVVRAWVDTDSNGKYPAECSHPYLFRAAIEGKAMLNLQIKDWAAGYFVCGARSWIAEAKEEGLDWLPDWVWDAVVNQAHSLDD